MAQGANHVEDKRLGVSGLTLEAERILPTFGLGEVESTAPRHTGALGVPRPLAYLRGSSRVLNRPFHPRLNISSPRAASLQKRALTVLRGVEAQES